MSLPIFLASTSPRRIEMMGWLGVPFKTLSTSFDESIIRHGRPRKLTRLLAEAKAAAAAALHPGSIVIGSDAVVSFHDQLLEKPKNREEQRQMLAAQRGQDAVVYASICVINTVSGQRVIRSKTTHYRMADVPWPKLETYIQSGKGMDKAGGYGQQDEGGTFVEYRKGCYPNALGFPICEVAKILRQMGVPIAVDIKKVVQQNTGRSC
jgi:septum formation protein